MRAVDATYRADLRELNELNFARFDAKLEQRLAEMQAKFEVRLNQAEARLDARIDALEARLDAKIDRTAAELRETIERGLKEHTRWLFLAWASLLIPIIGLWMRP